MVIFLHLLLLWTFVVVVCFGFVSLDRLLCGTLTVLELIL